VKPPFDLQPGEQVVLLTRRHWLYFVPRFLAEALAALAPPIVLLLLLRVAGDLTGTALRVALLISLLWLLFWLARIALLKYRYDHDVWAVTDQRVVDVVATSPFNFHMASTDLVRIQDIETDIHGLFQRVFDYGNLSCQTAGEVEHFTFRGVPNPRQIASVVERESLRAKGYQPGAAPPANRPPTGI